MDIRTYPIHICEPSEGISRTFYVYCGLNVSELKRILESVFKRTGVVAVETQDGSETVSLSIICEYPEMFTDKTFRLVREKTSRPPLRPQYTEEESTDDDELWVDQSNLLNAVGQLESQQLITPTGAENLRMMISEEDDRVVAAARIFFETNDWQDFSDSLIYLSECPVSTKAYSPPSPSITGSYSTQSEEESSSEESQADDDAYESEDVEYVLQLLDEFFSRDMLSLREVVTLVRLLDAGNPLIHAAIEVYDEENDTEDCIDTLKRICVHYGIDGVVLSMMEANLVDDEEAEMLLNEFHDEDSNVTQVWRDYCTHLNGAICADRLLTIIFDADKKKFLEKIAGKGYISPSEYSVLVRLAEEEDAVFLAIFDVLLSTGDISDTIDSLHRLCKIRGDTTTTTTIASSSQPLQPFQISLLELVRQLHMDSVLTENESTRIAVFVSSEPAKTQSLFSEYLNDQNIDSLIRRLIAISSPVDSASVAAARNESRETASTIISIIAEMVEMGLLIREEAILLASLIKSNDPRLLGAFDAFQSNQDVEDFADTLQRIVTFTVESASDYDDDEDDDIVYDDEEEEVEEGEEEDEDTSTLQDSDDEERADSLYE